jgi:cbb3-type cytochrome c oxidase subunit III
MVKTERTTLESGTQRAVYLSLLLGIGFSTLVTLSLAVAQEDSPGKEVYDSKCLMCHGDDAKGDTKAGKMMKTPDLTTESWKQGTSVSELVKTLREGLGKMPKYEGKLSEQELKVVAEYTLKLSEIEE